MIYGTNFKIPLIDTGFHYHSLTIFGLYILTLIFINPGGLPGRFFGKRIDILFEDRFKEKLIIELKIGNLQRNALCQVMEYEGYILSEKDPSARVMIVANRIPLNLKKAMEHHGIEYKEI